MAEVTYRDWVLRRLLAPIALCATLVVPLAPASPASAATSDRNVTYTQWDTGKQLRTGARAGVKVAQGSLVLDGATKHRAYRGTTYDTGSWTSGWVASAFSFTALVSSWSASTPKDSWVEVRVRVATAAARSKWRVLGRWTSGDKHVLRTSVPNQSDALGRVDVDTWKATGAGASSYQLQVRLMRRSGSSAVPSVGYAGAMVSALPSTLPATSAPGVARGVVLPVPAYSQMIHSGDFAQYGGGGEAWCSPTSTSMVLGYYGKLPTSLAWVGARPDPWVDEVARRTYDYSYSGTGNWPFNTAYAASRGLHAFVTRLRSLDEAEQLIAAGIPVIASISFSSGQLSGAPISSTAGHLVVIVGFDANGNPVVNDPAASSNASVQRTYDRAQFEKVWLGGSGGTAYVIHDDAHPLPASAGNW